MTTQTMRIPAAACRLRLQDQDVQLAAAQGDKPRTFDMLANSGEAIPHWYFGKLAIDLSGVQHQQRVPLLLDHDTGQRLGFTTEVKADASGLRAKGQFLGGDATKALLADADQGFPFQASVYLQAQQVQRLADNETASVNGRLVNGPATIFRRSQLREVTMTVMGADPNTSTAALSDGGDAVVAELSPPENPMEPNEPKAAAKADPNPAQDAMLAEQKRVDAILEAAGDTQAALGRKLVKDRVPLDEALLALNKDLRARLSERQATAVEGAEALGGGNKGGGQRSPKPDAQAALADMDDGPEKWEAEFKASAKLRREFAALGDAKDPTGQKAYLAARQAESAGRTRRSGTTPENLGVPIEKLGAHKGQLVITEDEND